MEKKWKSKSPEETLEIARVFAKTLKPGDCVALEGGLGSGKTLFIKGLVMGLGLGPDEVTSPTFVLMHVYKTEIPLYHYDLYRLDTKQDLIDIGFDEFVGDPRAVTAIEWAQKAKGLLPSTAYHVYLKVMGETVREIAIRRGNGKVRTARRGSTGSRRKKKRR